MVGREPFRRDTLLSPEAQRAINDLARAFAVAYVRAGAELARQLAAMIEEGKRTR